MKLTPDQRRKRILNMMEQNPDFMRIRSGCDSARNRFQKLTAWLPPRLRNALREYPGMMYFMYQRIIDTVCAQMRFPDED